ncbi:MAG: tetratricopeptide repeat protein, partial [Candidatus Acidiferrales bacterium]
FAYANLAGAYMALNRYAEAKAIQEEKLGRFPDDVDGHLTLYVIAYLQNDTAAMQRHADWAKGKSAEAPLQSIQAGIAAGSGQMQKSRELVRQAAEIARRYNLGESAATWEADLAVSEALCGDLGRARAMAKSMLASPGGVRAKATAAFALTLAGEVGPAQAIVDEVARRFPTNTILQNVQVPSLRAAIELERRNPERALELLERVRPYELAFPPAIYLRGRAYLEAGKGAEAAAEFDKILKHRGIDPVGLLTPLAQLGVARAYNQAGKSAEARKAYQDFLALWKDADSDLPLLQQAKAEYAKLK